MNNPYLFEVSCYDCMNCRFNNKNDPYCQSACIKCNQISPGILQQPMSPLGIWYNPSQFPYGHYYGSYSNSMIMY